MDTNSPEITGQSPRSCSDSRTVFSISPLHSGPSQGDAITDGKLDHQGAPARGQGLPGSEGWRHQERLPGTCRLPAPLRKETHGWFTGPSLTRDARPSSTRALAHLFFLMSLSYYDRVCDPVAINPFIITSAKPSQGVAFSHVGCRVCR